MQCTFAELTAWATPNSQRLIDEFGVVPSEEPEDVVKAEDIAYYLDCMTPAVRAFCADHGLVLHEDRIEFDPSKFDAIRVLTQGLAEEYENGGDNLWIEYDLGGDDDVDYCGGYIDCAMEVLEAYAKDNA